MNECMGRPLIPSGRLVHRMRLGFCIGCLLLVLSGCARSTVSISFEGLCGLTHEEFATMDEATLIPWVEEHYGVTPSKMGERVEAGVVVPIYTWLKGKTRGSAMLHDGSLVKIWLEDVQNGPTFGQVVETLGPPKTLYRSATGWEGTMYTLGLEYPELGFSVKKHDWLWGYVNQVTLSEDIQVNAISCYAPGSLEEIMQEINMAHPEVITDALRFYYPPWPGFGASVTLERGLP